jgi:hypothetical protein
MQTLTVNNMSDHGHSKRLIHFSSKSVNVVDWYIDNMVYLFTVLSFALA